ncbi:MAG: hypothetical protein GF328_06695, partial [Candidatus Latescibacteria bacterium]|nr:hypothetical protein [Candidatus Latescibacterota bacterium]
MRTTRAISILFILLTASAHLALGATLHVPGTYATIQAAVDASSPGDEIVIAAGTYEEQVVITTDDITLTGAGVGSTTIKSPVSLTDFFTTSVDNYPVVFVNGATGLVLEHLTVDGFGRGNANYRFIGVGFYNGGGAVLDCEIKDIRDTPFSGSQHGVALYAYNTDGGPYSLEAGNCTFPGFQKNAMALSGEGLTVDVHDCEIVGAGVTTVIAQNGIQISHGAGGTVTDCEVSDVWYDGTGWTAAGVLPYFGTTVDITDTVVTDAQTGTYYIDTDGSVEGLNTTNAEFDALTISNSSAGFTGESPEIGVSGGEVRAVPKPVVEADGRGDPTPSAMTVSVAHSCFTGPGEPDAWGIGAYSSDGTPLTVTVTNSVVSDWTEGMVAGDPGVTLTANDNSITGNTTAGYDNLSGEPQDAQYNWWGDAGGPDAVGGDDVIGGDVDYDPWRIDGTDTDVACGFQPPLDENTVTPEPAGGCISTAHPCVNVEFDVERLDSAAMRGFSVTFALSTELMLCSGLPSITEGDYLSDVGGTSFQIIDHEDGSYTVDCAILGLPCGATAATGTLFSADVKNSGGDGTGTITVTSVTMRDCDNVPIVAGAGDPASITVDNTAPTPVSDLAAAQVKSGNDSDGTTKVTVNFTDPPEGDLAGVEVYRAPYVKTDDSNAYPEYNDHTGAGSPSIPTYPP